MEYAKDEKKNGYEILHLKKNKLWKKYKNTTGEIQRKKLYIINKRTEQKTAYEPYC